MVTRPPAGTIPDEPGSYQFKDKRGRVIYVGKARDLRGRVRAYFNNSDERSQIEFLVRRVEDIETLVTNNDKEALILENNLIKGAFPTAEVTTPATNTVVVVTSDPIKATDVTAAGGWLYNSTTGEIRVNDTTAMAW